MNSIFLSITYALLLPLICGGIFVRILLANRWSKLFFLERLSMAFLFGQGLLAQSIFLTGWIGIEFTFFHLSSALLVLTGVLVFFILYGYKVCGSSLKGSASFDDLYSHSSKPFFLMEKVIVFFVILFACLVFYRIIFIALAVPIYTWDSIATVAFQAKVFFYEGGLRLHPYAPHPSFPLHMPFSIVWFSQCLGFFDQQWVKLLPPLYLLATLSLLMSFCYRVAGRLTAYISLAVMLASPLIVTHATIIYRDVPLMAYVFLTVAALCYGLSLRDRVWIWVAALSAGFGCFVKSEALFYMPIFILVFCVWALCESRRHHIFSKESILKYAIDFFLIGSVFPVAYIIYKNSMQISLGEQTVGAALNVSVVVGRILRIMKRFLEESFFSANWNIVWPAFLIGIILGGKVIWKNKIVLLLLTVIVGHMGIIIVSGIVASPRMFDDIINRDTFARLFSHVFPVVIAALMIVWSKSFEEKPRGRDN